METNNNINNQQGGYGNANGSVDGSENRYPGQGAYNQSGQNGNGQGGWSAGGSESRYSGQGAAKRPEIASISVVDVLMYLLGHWPWFVLSVIVFTSAAWLYYATSPRIYHASATVIIKDPSNKTTSAGFDRYDNYINRVNVANEILQFQSKALMREVVQRLNADVNYVVKDGLTTKELYTTSPINVKFIGTLPSARISLEVTPKNRQTAQVVLKDENGDDAKRLTVKMGVPTVLLPGDTIMVSPTSYFNEKSDEPIAVTKLPLTEVTNRYVGSLGITQEKDEGTILRLAVTDASPRRGEDVLNTLIQVYNEGAIADKNRVAVNTANFIAERLEIIEKELGGAEADIESYKRDNQIISIDATAGRYMGESEKYSAEAIQIETELSIASDMKRWLMNPSYSGELIPANTGLTQSVENQIADYNRQLLELEKMQAVGGNNPRVAELKESIASQRQSIVRSIDNAVAGLRVRLRDASASEQRAQSRVTTIPTKEREMLSLERKQKIKESLYLFLLNRREENSLSQAMADNNARVIDEAVGVGPVSPKRNQILLLGLMAGFLLPALILIIKVFLDNKVRTHKDLTRGLTIPYLGSVPLDPEHLKRQRKGLKREQDEKVNEAMKILRTNMAFMRSGTGQKIGRAHV